MEWHLVVETKKEGDWIIASFPPLDVHSQGLTINEALEHLKEALSLFFESCYERGVLGDVLKDAGFHASPGAVAEKPGGNRYLLKVPFKLASDHVPSHAG